MATRMQQRRGTAAQWTSSNNGDGPILNAGEIGWESDTNKFKIGDGVNYWADLVYFADVEDIVGASLSGYVETSDIGAVSGVAGLDSSKNVIVPGSSIIVEGATDNAFETTLTVTDPTADRTITLPDATGTVITTGNLSSITSVGTLDNLTITGDLTVNGTTTNINSTNLVVEDKNIVLADVATPTDVTADGGGITLKGTTDKTFNWVDSTDAWTSSEHINLASGKTLKYNGTDLVAAQSGNSGKFLTTDGTSTSWATVSGYSAPTLGSTSIASGATVTTIVGLTKVRSDVFTTLDVDGYEVDIETMTIMGAF